MILSLLNGREGREHEEDHHKRSRVTSHPIFDSVSDYIPSGLTIHCHYQCHSYMLGMYLAPIHWSVCVTSCEVPERRAEVKVIDPNDASLNPGIEATTVVLTPVCAS